MSPFSHCVFSGSESRPKAAVNKQKFRNLASPDTALLKVFPFALDNKKLVETVVKMGLAEKVYIASKLEQASAVLALRSSLKQSPEVRIQAKDAKIPIYAIKDNSGSNFSRAFRTLMGIDAAPGSPFSEASDAPAASSPSSSGESMDDSGDMAASSSGATASKAEEQGLSKSGGCAIVKSTCIMECF